MTATQNMDGKVTLVKEVDLHCSGINSIQVIEGGKKAITAGKDNRIRFVDISTGTICNELEGHNEEVVRLAVSRDEHYLLSGSFLNVFSKKEQCSILLWDLVSKTKIRNYPQIGTDNTLVTDIAISPDREFIFAGMKYGDLLKVKLNSDDIVLKFAGLEQGFSKTSDGTISLQGGIKTIALSPNGKTILAGGGHKVIVEWDASTGTELRRFCGHTGDITCLSYSPDMKFILSGSIDQSMCLWNANTGQLLKQFDHPDHVTALAFLDDDSAISLCKDGKIRFWNLAKKEKTSCTIQQEDGISCFAVVEKSRQIVTGNASGKFRLWEFPAKLETIGSNIENEPKVLQSKGSLPLPFCDVASFSTNNNFFVVCNGSGEIQLFDLGSMRPLARAENMKGAAEQIALSKRFLICLNFDGSVTMFSFEKRGECIGIYNFQREVTKAINLTANDSFLVMGGESGTLNILDLRSGDVSELGEHPATIWHVASSQDEKFILSYGWEQSVNFWDIWNERKVSSSSTYAIGHAHHLAIAPNGKRFLVCSFPESNVAIYDSASGKEIKKYPEAGSCGIFIPGTNLCVFGGRNSLKAVNTETGVVEAVFRPNEGTVKQLKYSPENKRLYAFIEPGGDGRVDWWDMSELF